MGTTTFQTTPELTDQVRVSDLQENMQITFMDYNQAAFNECSVAALAVRTEQLNHDMLIIGSNLYPNRILTQIASDSPLLIL